MDERAESALIPRPSTKLHPAIQDLADFCIAVICGGQVPTLACPDGGMVLAVNKRRFNVSLTDETEEGVSIVLTPKV